MTVKLFAGIDISANDALLCCLDQDGHQLGPSRSFTNDLCGAQRLLDAITEVKAQEVRIGLEATSVYCVHLRDFLTSAGQANPNWFIYEIIPPLVARFKKSFSKRPKTDHHDTWLIAERVRFGQLEPFIL